jgi:hypothetical protein
MPGICLVSFELNNMYSLFYWNERKAEWLPCGCRPSADLQEIRKHQFRLIEQCDGCVRFRITHASAYAG